MDETTRSTQPLWRRLLPLFLAFMLGACIALVATGALTQSSLAEQAPVAATATTETDISELFPSWDPESSALAELVGFVQDVCDPQSAHYLEPQDRIATFDMDGTIISEKAPFYLDYMLLIHRVLDDPDHRADAETVAIIEEVRDNAYQGKKDSSLSAARHAASDAEFADMTPGEFRAYVRAFLDEVEVKGFDGMTYGQSFYQPMLEIIAYLQANDFDVWMVSACNREIVRAVVEPLGIAPDHVIGANIAYTTTGQGDQDPTDYTMGLDEDLVLSMPLADDCEKNGKPLAIAREIGKRPVLAFGNSSGDYAMLNYAAGDGGMALLIVADDEAREYGNVDKAADAYQAASEQGWTAVSMADDWATIYGEGVTKTELPGPVATEELAEAA